jgi:hypothetical protein
MTLIKGINNKIFVPTTIYNSPFNPDTDMIIIMRSNDDIDALGLDCRNLQDVNLIAKKYLIR